MRAAALIDEAARALPATADPVRLGWRCAT